MYPTDLVLTTPPHRYPSSRLFAGILQQAKENFHNGLQQAEAVSRATNDVQESSSVPDYAHKMNGSVFMKHLWHNSRLTFA